jgi:hypothetical protein
VFSLGDAMQRPGWNPVRRNRNVGTAKQGRGRDNRMVIPSNWHDSRTFWQSDWQRCGPCNCTEQFFMNLVIGWIAMKRSSFRLAQGVARDGANFGQLIAAAR